MKTMSCFGEEVLCMIDDCRFNEDAVCSKGVWPLSEECNKIRSVTENKVSRIIEKKFSLEDFHRLELVGTSKGNQEKYASNDNSVFFKTRFQYEGRFWNDDCVEVIASGLGKQFNFNLVEQHFGKLGDKYGVYSKMFEEVFIPYNRIDVGCQFLNFQGVDRLKFAEECIEKVTGVECWKYFYQMLLLDELVGNEDRHEANFGVFKKNNRYSVALLFDFGLGLFEHDSRYFNLTLEEAIPTMSKKPFGNRIKCIEWLESNFNFERPKYVDSSGLIFPSKLGHEYFKWALNRLEVRDVKAE